MKLRDFSKIHFPGTLLAVVAMTPGLQGCFSNPTVPSRPTASTLNLDSVPPLPAVDAAQLRISNIVVAQYADPRTGGTMQPVLDFRYSASTDYVEAKTCVDTTGACTESKNIFENKGTLANAPDGARVVVQLRACVNPERSKGSSNCGSWYSQEYTQWASTNKEKTLLQEEFEAIERDAKELDKKLKTVLKLREERAAKCKPATEGAKALLEAERGLVGSITRLGGGIVGAIAKKLTERPPPSDSSTGSGSGAGASGGSGSGSSSGSGGGALEPAVYALAPGQELALSSGGSGRQIIVAQDPKFVPKLLSVMSEALKLKSSALKLISREKNFNAGAATAEAPAEGAKPSAEGAKPPAEGAKPTGGDPAATDPKAGTAPAGEAADKASKALSQAASSGGAVNWEIITGALPTLADAIFDMANADRRVALEGICVDGLGTKLEETIKMAEEETNRAIMQLTARAQRVRAKLGEKP
jgi:hypothetical protein